MKSQPTPNTIDLSFKYTGLRWEFVRQFTSGLINKMIMYCFFLAVLFIQLKYNVIPTLVEWNLNTMNPY